MNNIKAELSILLFTRKDRVILMFKRNKIKEINKSVSNVKTFISDRGNPYNLDDTSKNLKNLSSQVLAITSVKDKILRFHELSAEKFKDFQKGVYVQRCTLISETIHRYDLPRLDYEKSIKSADSREVKVSKKEIKDDKRLLKIAADRVSKGAIAYTFDITPFNPLFQRQYMISKAVHAEHYEDADRTPTSTCVIVDLMSYLRSEVIKSSITADFESLVDYQFKKLMNSYPNRSEHLAPHCIRSLHPKIIEGG